MLVISHLSMMPKTTGDVSLVASYGPKEVVPLAPPLCFAAQGPPPGIPMDSTLKVISQLELMNLIGHLVNGFGQELSAPSLGAVQQAVRG
uniref:Uncharacterized protein n=1 Tax=Romanomermis culicivorax TaxID=13658 RepID=A0A915JKJ5_ROMCU